MLLAGIRCAVIGLLTIIWAEPILATYVHRRIDAHTLLLVDASASMALRDRYPDPADRRRAEEVIGRSDDPEAGDPSRTDLVHAVLGAGDSGLLARLARRNPVLVYQFGQQLTFRGQVLANGAVNQTTPPPRDDISDDSKVEPASPPDALVFGADEPVTDIGQALQQAIDAQAGQPIAAIVVLSDGQFNKGISTETAARYARDRKLPIHAVGVGDPAGPRNVAVTAIEAPQNVFVNDPFKITAHLRTQGLTGATCTVELLERSPSTDELTIVASKPMVVDTEGHIPPVTFSYQIGKAARTRLVVRSRPQDGETLIDDNQKEITVRALDNKMRVLVVAGGPSWEYRYLTRLLHRDATINVSCWLQSADDNAIRDGNTIIDHFPREPEALSDYDCIILMDPQPGDVDPTWAASVESIVSNVGGGLLYVAGRKHTPTLAHDAGAQPLLDMLPVDIDAGDADLILNKMSYYQRTAWPVIVPQAVINHPVLAMSSHPDENARIWDRLGGVYWHYPARRAKPVATVLLRHANPQMVSTFGPHVLLATQFLGSGRTGFLAYDSTWRWRRLGDRYFNRFWIQLLRHLVEGKLISGQKRGLIQLERDHCTIRQPVAVEARLLDRQHLPLAQDQIQASVYIADQALDPMTLESQPGRPGWYRGQFVPTRTGIHVFRIDLPGGENVPAATIRSELHVGRADLEYRQTRLDRGSLQLLASSSAGGQYLEIDQTDQLVSLIPTRTTSLVLSGQPTPLWNRWWTLGLLVGLLGTEWALRKRARLL